jgi:phosphatidylglycerophosphatase A
MNRIKALLVTGLGGGYFPIAPGTVGSAFVAAAFLITAYLSGGDSLIVNGVLVGILIFSCVVCVMLGNFTERAFGKKDPGQCVIDEWAGQAVALLGAPLAGADVGRMLTVAAIGFFAFRVFDIFKPFPARRMEKLPKGWGVLCDDLIAGLYALVVVQLWRIWV